MTASATLVTALSGYVENTDFTSAEFTTYLGMATAQFAKDCPSASMPTALQDEAVSLLICHYIHRKLNAQDGDLQSEKTGDHSFARFSNVSPHGYLGEYKRIISGSWGKTFSAGVTPDDATLPKAFRMSEQTLPKFG